MINHTKNGTIIVRVMCAIFFLLFTFLYLFEYQADVLAVTQHVLSHGATHYNRTIGAVLITAVLLALQWLVYGFSTLSGRFHALTYLPSLLLLGILTDVTSNVDHEPYLGHWLWTFPLLMVAFVGLVWVCRQLESLEQMVGAAGIFSRLSWQNLLAMVVMAFVVCGIGNSDQLFHYRMRMESDMSKKHYAAALRVGTDESATDSSLTMLRVWALSENHLLGDRLFSYPLTGGSDAMLPNGGSVKLMLADERRLYAHLGVVFKQPMRPLVYLEALHRQHRATPAAHDWLLCAYLLDRKLEQFARCVTQFYAVNDSLPIHYREALILYNHTTSHPVADYHNSVMEADFEDFQDLGKKYADRRERYTALRDKYGNTYWFYYEFDRRQW